MDYKMPTRTKVTAYDCGYKAFAVYVARRQIIRNPYRSGAARDGWNRGWRDAVSDHWCAALDREEP